MATSSEAFKVFKSIGTIIFIHSEKEGTRNAPHAVAALRRQKYMGNTIPMVMVTTADGSEGIEGFGYDILSDDVRKAARTLKKELREINVVGSLAEEEIAADSPLLAEQQQWTNHEGQNLTAAVQKMGDQTVTFLMPDGKSVEYPLAQLSEKSRAILLAIR